MQYRIYSLVDITNTGQYRNEPGRELARHQQQNFDTVTQTIGMRANIVNSKPPKIKIAKPQDYGMDGTDLTNIWIYEWGVEREDLFLNNDDDVARLKQDFEFVPYISGLTETIKYDPAIFRPGVNISFEMVR